MQTFLPYNSFLQSARCLDQHRLGKQRIETVEILVTLSEEQPDWMSDAWYARCQAHANHPAVKMWEGYEYALADYGVACCYEWMHRGFKDTLLEKIDVFTVYDEFEYPHWFGEPMFHASHRGNLLRKKPEHYGAFGWTEDPATPYWWPTKQNV